MSTKKQQEQNKQEQDRLDARVAHATYAKAVEVIKVMLPTLQNKPMTKVKLANIVREKLNTRQPITPRTITSIFEDVLQVPYPTPTKWTGGGRKSSNLRKGVLAAASKAVLALEEALGYDLVKSGHITERDKKYLLDAAGIIESTDKESSKNSEDGKEGHSAASDENHNKHKHIANNN